MIIGVSGYMGSGKDTAGKIIQELTMVTDHGNYPSFTIQKFAAKLKDVAAIILGVDASKFEDQEYKDSYLPEQWDYDQKVFIEQGVHDVVRKRMKVREFLQSLGTDAVRNRVHTNAWVNSLMCEYKDGDNWVITDVRFPNEAKAIKEKNGIIIRLNRYPPGCSPRLMDLHESEIGLDEWEFDEVIFNVGTIDDLRSQIREILIRLEKQNLITT